MRDIREDLEARRREMIARHSDVMHAYEVDIDRLMRERREAVDAFDKERATLDAMIALEEARLGSNERREVQAATDLNLRDLIVATVQSRQPLQRDELREIARAAGFEGGRTFNMTLQNVLGGGAIKKLPSGEPGRRSPAGKPSQRQQSSGDADDAMRKGLDASTSKPFSDHMGAAVKLCRSPRVACPSVPKGFDSPRLHSLGNVAQLDRALAR